MLLDFLQSTSGVFGSEGTADQVSVTHMADGRVITGSDSGHLYVWVNAKLDSVIRDIHPVSFLDFRRSRRNYHCLKSPAILPVSKYLR